MRGMSSRVLTGGLIGAALGMYAMSQMSPKDRRKMMKKGRKMLSSATRDMNFF